MVSSWGLPTQLRFRFRVVLFGVIYFVFILQTTADNITTDIQPMLGGRRILWTAQYSRKVKFAATSPCQERVSNEWNWGIKSNYFVLFWTYFCPFLLNWNSIQNFGLWEDNDGVWRQVKDVTLCQRIKIFYQSAIVKHMVAFVSRLSYSTMHITLVGYHGC